MVFYIEKKKINSNKNIAVGSAILEILILLIFEFYYNVFNVQCLGERQVQVHYGDTDSLLLKIKAENLLANLENGKQTSSRLEYTNWDKSIHPKIVKRQAPNKFLFLKFETGAN